MICDGSAPGSVWKRMPSQPWASSLPRITARHHRVGKNEKPGRRPAFLRKPFQQQAVFVIEHRFQALAADVTLGVPVNGVADGHVVGGDGLGDGAGRAADAEKPAGHFLSGADFGEGAVFGRVQVDLERFLMRAYNFTCHVVL